MGQIILSTENIIKGCLAFEKNAQESLFYTYYNTIMRVCIRYSSDLQEAKDITQETFIVIYRKLPQYQGIGSFEGWIRKIAARTAINYQKRIRKSSNTDLMEDYLVLENHIQVQDVGQKLEYEDLMSTIFQLPEVLRNVFLLFEVDGFSHHEIAKMLSISEAASKTYLYRAKIKLQDVLSVKN